ncbi:TPA: ead/Ea22-like family protein [Raoultella ornithinolytica]|nr:ead/Ea22-like family protein [Raoultella ornithinolytica]
MTTDITELAQSLKAAAEKAGIEQWVNNRGEVNTADYEVDGGVYIDHICNCEIVGTESPRAEFIAMANPANILALVEALEKAQQEPSMPLGLHPDTQKLVANFCTALAEKLYKAQLKYGYDADWKQDGWPSQCQAHFHQHIAKGDPRDVAAYCAFMWYHGWSTKPDKALDPIDVHVKFPHQTDFDDPLSAYEAIEKCKEALAAAGIKVEAE